MNKDPKERLIQYLDNNCDSKFSTETVFNKRGSRSEWLLIKNNIITFYEAAFECLGRNPSISLINTSFDFHNLPYRLSYTDDGNYGMIIRK